MQGIEIAGYKYIDCLVESIYDISKCQLDDLTILYLGIFGGS